MRRSPDGGKTWEPPQVIANYDTNTADNPVAIWDNQKRRCIFSASRSTTRKFYHLRSDDGGEDFLQTGVSITAEQLAGFQKVYPSKVIAPGQGMRRIQLKSGRLLAPGLASPGAEKAQGKESRASPLGDIGHPQRRPWQNVAMRRHRARHAEEQNETGAAVEADDGGVFISMFATKTAPIATPLPTARTGVSNLDQAGAAPGALHADLFCQYPEAFRPAGKKPAAFSQIPTASRRGGNDPSMGWSVSGKT